MFKQYSVVFLILLLCLNGDANRVRKSSNLKSPLTTKGDVYTFSTQNARLGVGSNDQVLTADSTQTTGLKWATPTTGLTVSGTDNRIVRMNGTSGLQDSALTCDDVGNITGAKTFDLSSLTADRAIYGDSGKALTSSATTSAQLAYLSSFISNLTSEGDIFYHNGTNITRLPRGSDDQYLRATATSIAWETVAGGGGNSFETITTDQGTSPVADSSTDTLDLTSSDGSLDLISGNSTTDTIDFSVRYSNPTNDTTNECFGNLAVCGTNGASSGGNTAIGSGAVAGDSDSGLSTAIGQGAGCTGSNSVCIGQASAGTADNQVIIGSSQDGGATASVVNIGSLNTCTGDVCVGVDSDGQGGNAIAIGNQCDIEADTISGICIGKSATVGDGGSAVGFGISIGDSATVGWGYGIAIGRAATTNFASVVIGRNATSTAHNQVILGGNSQATKDIWIGEGVTDATSNPISINSTERTGTNAAGNSITFSTRGTGTGESGDFIFKAGVVGTSGTTAHTQATLMQLDTATHYVGIGQTSPATKLELEEVKTLTSSPADGYASALTLDPGYTGAFTVTRHNYIELDNVSVAASAVVTDATVFRFDAAAGTHKAVDGATTKSTPGGVDAWVKININGTIYYMPAYTSKTL